MEERQRVAIGTVVMRNKQYLTAVRPLDGALAMSTMRFADEVVPKSDVEAVPDRRSKPDAKTLRLATQLIDAPQLGLEPQGVPRHLHRGAARADRGQGSRARRSLTASRAGADLGQGRRPDGGAGGQRRGPAPSAVRVAASRRDGRQPAGSVALLSRETRSPCHGTSGLRTTLPAMRRCCRSSSVAAASSIGRAVGSTGWISTGRGHRRAGPRSSTRSRRRLRIAQAPHSTPITLRLFEQHLVERDAGDVAGGEAEHEVAAAPADRAQRRLGLVAADRVDDEVGAAAGDLADRRLQVDAARPRSRSWPWRRPSGPGPACPRSTRRRRPGRPSPRRGRRRRGRCRRRHRARRPTRPA